LEVARRLKSASFDRDVIFALFAFEESGLYGSLAYVNSLASADLPDSDINLDMVGFTSATEYAPTGGSIIDFPTKGNFLAAVGSYGSRELLLDFINSAASFAPELSYYAVALDSNQGSNPLLSDAMRSDHSSFWARGVPAIMLSDTGNLRAGHPYHSSADSADKIDSAFMTASVRAVLATVCVRAGINP
jgi:Zn-dependent M28 family amino/carboxypeptidase